MNELKKIGYVKAGTDIYTYQMGDVAAEYSGTESTGTSQPVRPVRVSGYSVYPFGENNTEPNQAKELISSNRLLPELIEKQIRMLYGSGPVLYQTQLDDKGMPMRKYLQDIDIELWLDSWKENGLPDSFQEYINKCIRTYYYCEGIFSMWYLTKGSAFGHGKPVAGLEHISVLRSRLGTLANLGHRTDFEDREFDKVLVGAWSQSSSTEFKVYPRFDYVNPLKRNCAISYSKNPSHGEEIYSFNVFYRGIKEWIKGSNLSAKYINDYLENALSARLHIIIPGAWLKAKERMISEMCKRNADRKAAADGGVVEYEKIQFSDNETLEVGCEYNDGLLNIFASMELKRLTNFLSGKGKNQGKVYASYSYINQDGNEERWKIEEIPQKYKEYIEAIKTYDERADYVMLSSKGIDPSISNISKEGVISKSGADVYYNYMIYLSGLTIPEEVVCRDINMVLKINFPDRYKQGIRMGFYRSIIARQQDISPDNRITNNTL